MEPLSDALVERLYADADAARWPTPATAFREALAASVEKTFAGRTPDRGEVERYIRSLHLADLALACACAAGVDGAWEHLIREHRPALYRAADAIDPTGHAREIVDALWADLFRNLFRYFHGRSSLTTWLRSVLAQRHVDAVRANRRLEPFADAELLARPAPPAQEAEESRCRQLVRRALEAAIGQLDARDRLRLACYHAQQLTLAETGRLLREHEATVSRRLAATRRRLRDAVERWMAEEGTLPADEVRGCVRAAIADAGALDLAAMLGDEARKISALDRSKRGVV